MVANHRRAPRDLCLHGRPRAARARTAGEAALSRGRLHRPRVPRDTGSRDKKRRRGGAPTARGALVTASFLRLIRTPGTDAAPRPNEFGPMVADPIARIS